MRISKKQFILLLLSIIVFFTVVGLTTGLTGDAASISLRIVVGLIFAFCLYRGSKESELINPYWVFSLTPLSLLVYTERISSFYLKELTTSTWLLATLNMIGILLGMSLIRDNKYQRKIERTQESPYETPDRLVRYAVTFFVIGRIPTVYHLLFGQQMPFNSIVSLFIFASIVFVMKSKKRKWIIGLSIANVVIMLTGSVNKTILLFLIMAYLVSFERFYATTEKTKRKVVVNTVVLGFLMIYVAFPLKDYFTTGSVGISGFFSYDTSTTSNYYSSRITWTGNTMLMMPYMYFVSAWNNVQYVVQTQPETHFAMWTIKPILGYLQLDGMFESIYTLKPYSSFNTFTYITVFFKDYGYWGSILGSIGLGAFIKFMYSSKYKHSYSAFDIACYSMTACATLEMFFSNHFFGLSYPFTIIILMWISKVIIYQRKVKK